MVVAEQASATEAGHWRQAGIVAGATVADIGCGPAATSVLLARAGGPRGG
jgi:hypothetical protein